MHEKKEIKNIPSTDNSAFQNAGNILPSSKKNTVRTIGIFLIFIIFIFFSYYLGTKGYKISIQSENNLLTPTQPYSKPTDIINLPTTEIKIPDTSPSAIIDPAKQYPNSEVFTSASLGIRFRYAKKGSGSGIPSETYSVKEEGNRVYVYFGQSRPESGQYVEVFTKNPADSLETAIKKQFLSGIPETDCFVKILSDKNLPANFIKATIAYPIPTDASEPPFFFGEKCPQGYSQSNGIRYFLADKNHPEKFIFFSIGQYAIPSELGQDTPYWQNTIEFLDINSSN